MQNRDKQKHLVTTNQALQRPRLEQTPRPGSQQAVDVVAGGQVSGPTPALMSVVNMQQPTLPLGIQPYRTMYSELGA